MGEIWSMVDAGFCSQCRWLLRWCQGQSTRLPMQEMKETQVRSLGREGTLEEEMATHSRVLAW